MVRATAPYKNNPRYEVCLKAVSACDGLRKSMEEYQALCAETGTAAMAWRWNRPPPTSGWTGFAPG